MSPVCRICFETSPVLIKPCKCSGTAAYVHEQCLLTWCATAQPRTLPLALMRTRDSSQLREKCEICNTRWKFRHKNRYAECVCVVFGITTLVVLELWIVGVMLYLCIEAMRVSWDIASSLFVVTMLCVGVLLVAYLLGMTVYYGAVYLSTRRRRIVGVANYSN